MGNIEDAEVLRGDELLELLGSIARELSEAETLQETAQRVVDLGERFLTQLPRRELDADLTAQGRDFCVFVAGCV